LNLLENVFVFVAYKLDNSKIRQEFKCAHLKEIVLIQRCVGIFEFSGGVMSHSCQR